MREVCLELGQNHYLLYFLGLLSCKEYWQNVKIPAEVKTGFLVLFALSVWQAQQELSCFFRPIFEKGHLPCSLPDQTVQGARVGYGAGMHGWLDDYCSGFHYGLLYCSLLVCNQKRVFFIQASLPFQPFTGFLMNYVSHSHSFYWSARLPVALQTAASCASCARSAFCHILHLGLGDLFYPSLSCP